MPLFHVTVSSGMQSLKLCCQLLHDADMKLQQPSEGTGTKPLKLPVVGVILACDSFSNLLGWCPVRHSASKMLCSLQQLNHLSFAGRNAVFMVQAFTHIVLLPLPGLGLHHKLRPPWVGGTLQGQQVA